MEGIKDPKMVPNAKFPTLALAIEKAFINLSRMTARGLPELIMRAPGMAIRQSSSSSCSSGIVCMEILLRSWVKSR